MKSTTSKLVFNLKLTPGLVSSIFFSILVILTVSCSEEEADDVMAIQGNQLDGQLDLKKAAEPSVPQMIYSGIAGASGSAIGPGGDLFVTEGASGMITRINLKSGESSTFTTGLPPSFIGLGGVTDVAFIGETAYALVTLVGSDLGGSDVVGIYRIDGPDSHTIIADLGAFTLANPPSTDFFVPTGVFYSIEVFRGGFLVADGHHNRVYYVTTGGEISILKSFGNIVPTGLEVQGNTIYMAQAGAVPHFPEDGKVVSINAKSTDVTELASGAPLLVDVERGRGQTLFALAQGTWDGVADGSPAIMDSGYLVKVNSDGTFSEIASELDRPTSLEIVGNTAYYVSLSGEVWTIDNISGPPFGK